MLNFLDLFSGIGGFRYALDLAGYKTHTHYFSEIDPYAQKVYAHHYPHAIPLGDIRTINGTKLKARHNGTWLITGGFPCQDVSSAGKRRGLGGARSSLWWEYHRLIGEIRPQIAIIENVPNLRGKGLDRVLCGLASIGYDAEWDVISAASIGAAHIRQRLWILAYPCGHGCRLRQNTQSQAGSNLADINLPNPPHQGSGAWTDWATIAAKREIYAQPLIRRVDDGVSSTVDRVRALGNSIVPACAKVVLDYARPLLQDDPVVIPDGQISFDP